MLKWTIAMSVAALAAAPWQEERPQPEPQEKVENPEFTHWEDFKEGSWVLFKDSYNIEGKTQVFEVRHELKKVEDENLLLEVKIGTPNISSPNVKILTKNIPSEIVSDKHMYELKEEGQEEVKVAGRTFQCRIFTKKYTAHGTPEKPLPEQPMPREGEQGRQQPGQPLPESQEPLITDEQLQAKTFVRIWVCDDVPGGIVRMLWLPLESYQQPKTEQPPTDQDQPEMEQPKERPPQDSMKALKTRELVSLFTGEEATPERP